MNTCQLQTRVRFFLVFVLEGGCISTWYVLIRQKHFFFNVQKQVQSLKIGITIMGSRKQLRL